MNKQFKTKDGEVIKLDSNNKTIKKYWRYDHWEDKFVNEYFEMYKSVGGEYYLYRSNGCILEYNYENTMFSIKENCMREAAKGLEEESNRYKEMSEKYSNRAKKMLAALK